LRYPNPDIEAEVRFLATEEGGKRQPCRSGSRTTHDFGLNGTLTDALHVFPGVTEVLPGETVTTRMSFMAPQYQAGRLYLGFRFTVQGAKRAGSQEDRRPRPDHEDPERGPATPRRI